MDKYRAANQKLWDTWTPHNVSSEFYDTEGFKSGVSTLDPVELAGFGDVDGKTLLHLQCHFGQDTLSWARLGATVTGVDFSSEAINAAQTLNSELGLGAHFVQSDIYELSSNLVGEFDCVFTSHGVLCWLQDLSGWAKVVAHFLKPGGVFYIVEAHPFVWMFDEIGKDQPLEPTLPYFQGGEPLQFEETGWYAVPESDITTTSYEWNHPLSDIVNALVEAGLIIDRLEEYPFMGWPQFDWMIETNPDQWSMPPDRPSLPLMFSLRAIKPE